MKMLGKAIVIGTLLMSSLVFAGFAGDVPVEIDWDAQTASGLPVTARFSDNPDERIGCGVHHTLLEGGGLYSYAFCQATIDLENRISCFTEHVELVDKIAEYQHYSFLRFSWAWNDELSYNECIYFNFTTQSHHIPEGLRKKSK